VSSNVPTKNKEVRELTGFFLPFAPLHFSATHRTDQPYYALFAVVYFMLFLNEKGRRFGRPALL
jgi:hypothetical protein